MKKMNSNISTTTDASEKISRTNTTQVNGDKKYIPPLEKVAPVSHPIHKEVLKSIAESTAPNPK